MAKLDVYVAEECWACEETRRIVADVAPQFPEVAIKLRDINNGNVPSRVFATPTYVLDDRVIYMGNPTREELKEKLALVQQALLSE
jgi:hypothetical protein